MKWGKYNSEYYNFLSERIPPAGKTRNFLFGGIAMDKNMSKSDKLRAGIVVGT